MKFQRRSLFIFVSILVGLTLVQASTWIKVSPKYVALTFDDGPRPQGTPALLAVLRKHRVKSTFFVVGKMAEKFPI